MWQKVGGDGPFQVRVSSSKRVPVCLALKKSIFYFSRGRGNGAGTDGAAQHGAALQANITCKDDMVLRVGRKDMLQNVSSAFIQFGLEEAALFPLRSEPCRRDGRKRIEATSYRCREGISRCAWSKALHRAVVGYSQEGD